MIRDPRVRAWLFRVVSNLALDHLRRHSTWKEIVPTEARDRAEADGPFLSDLDLALAAPPTKEQEKYLAAAPNSSPLGKRIV